MITHTHVDGSMTVGRHLNAGGDASVSGCMRVGRDLRVDGWLDAPNVKRDSKGLFLTPEALAEAYPWPEAGWWALVGTTLPADLYVVSGDGEWTPTGSQAGNLTIDTPSLASLADTIAVQSVRCEQAAVRAEQAADSLESLARTVADTADEARETADEAVLAARGASILPFDGFLGAHAGARPLRGVWYVQGTGSQTPRFMYVSSEYGYGESDYNDADALEGESAVRTDALFRLGNTLWHHDGHTMVRLADEPVQVAGIGEYEQIRAAGAERPGCLYCVVDESTRRVTDMFLGA